MGTHILTGDDSLILNDRTLTDFASADISTITFNGDVATLERSKNGNGVFAKNEQGYVAVLTLNLQKASGDDKFLNENMNISKRDFASSILLNGSFTQKIGDGVGGISKNTYLLKGGLITKLPDAKSNVAGDASQGMTSYNVTFADAEIVIR